MSARLPVKDVLHVLADDLAEGPDHFLTVVFKYELASLEDLLLAHARFHAYLVDRGQA